MKKQLFKTLMIWAVLFVLPLSLFAYDQYESLKVGETKIFSFPSEVTNRASLMYAYNCSSTHSNNVEVISYTNTSVTVKAVAYTQSQVYIMFDYWWYENGAGRKDTHVVHIDLYESGGGGGSNPDNNENPWGYDVDSGCWGTINIDEGETRKVYCQYNTTNPDNVKSIVWSQYGSLGYEITSQSSSSCTIKGYSEFSNQKLWCLMKYGNSSYKAYYTINVKKNTKETLTLTANPNGGEIEEGEKVYLTSTSGADIYYTLNGNTPTTSSSKYTSTGITINETCTLKAFARKSGYNDSPVMTWIFTINEENSTKVLIDATNFPDEIFRNYLLEQDYGKDGVLTKNEISALTELKVGEMNIGSLIGIEHFTALKTLDCYKNRITSLDLSANTVLTSVRCSENQLTDLNVSKNVALTSLDCGYNSQLTSIDVSKNINLEELNVWATSLAELEVTNNTKLTKLSCSGSTITSLNLTKNTLLTYLYLGKGALESLDLSHNNALTSLTCSENQITSLDLSNCTQLETLHCDHNQLTSLILPNSSKLTSFWMDHNRVVGIAMDMLVNSLPTNNTNEPHTFRILLSENGYKYLANGYRDNVCAKKQVAAIKAKGWTPLCYNNGGWVEYDGGYDIVIFANDCSREYGEDNPEFEYEVSGGELSGTPILSCRASKTSDVGTYNITVDQGTEQGSVAGVSGRLTVNKAPLTVSIENCTRKEGEPNPDFILHYSGWKNGENENVLTVKPTATTVATTNSSVGIYDIVVTGGEAKNYTFNYVNGTLTIEEKDYEPISISLPSSQMVMVGETITLIPEISPADAVMTLTWSSDDESIATVSSEGVVTGMKAGQTFIHVTLDNGKSASCKLTVTAPEKIKTPTISCVGGKLKFSCETEGVTFHYKITAAATSQEATGDEVELKPVYQVTVYATKADWIDSDEAVANINPLGLKGDVNDDGEVDIADAVKIVNLVVGKIDALSRSAKDVKDEKEPQ